MGQEGPKLAQALLDAGANDLGGTLINESISTSAGAQYGQLVGPAELHRWIRDAGRVPAQRDTLYNIVRRYDDGDDPASPLDSRRSSIGPCTDTMPQPIDNHVSSDVLSL